jgi:hypothetical protein
VTAVYRSLTTNQQIEVKWEELGIGGRLLSRNSHEDPCTEDDANFLVSMAEKLCFLLLTVLDAGMFCLLKYVDSTLGLDRKVLTFSVVLLSLSTRM